jgi:hypothetical protein
LQTAGARAELFESAREAADIDPNGADSGGMSHQTKLDFEQRKTKIDALPKESLGQIGARNIGLNHERADEETDSSEIAAETAKITPKESAALCANRANAAARKARLRRKILPVALPEQSFHRTVPAGMEFVGEQSIQAVYVAAKHRRQATSRNEDHQAEDNEECKKSNHVTCPSGSLRLPIFSRYCN